MAQETMYAVKRLTSVPFAIAFSAICAQIGALWSLVAQARIEALSTNASASVKN